MFNINIRLERIGREATEKQALDILNKVKAFGINKRNTLTEEEFLSIAGEALGQPAEPVKRGLAAIDKQVRTAGEEWLAEKTGK